MTLTLNGVSKSYGHLQILEEISFTVNVGERVGLVGANGAGKSTLLKIVAGEVACDEGRVELAGDVDVGYVPQTIVPRQDQTIEELLRESQRKIRALEQRMHELEEVMAAAQGAELAEAVTEYGEIAARFEHAGGYDLDYRIDEVLSGLGLAHLSRARRIATLSGGEKTRIALAAVLIQAPGLLLLDEPTNHLDFEMAAWLEEYLRRQPGALLVVSHDRRFLNAVATAIVEIDEHSHRARLYPGDYDAYRAQKQAERQAWEEEYARQQEEIGALRRRMRVSARQVGHSRPATDNNKIAYDRAGERVHQAISHNVRSAERALQRILADPIPRPPEPLRFTPAFDPAALGSARALAAFDLCKAFVGQPPVIDHVSIEIGPADRVLIVGPNGAGKSTLLRMLSGRLAPDRGSVSVAPRAVIGYLEQESTPAEPGQTLFEAYSEGLVGFDQDHMRDLLSSGLFTYEETRRPLGDLSLGQYRKLQIARLIASRANVLILDEPTNHLSLDVLEQFEQALHTFPGAIVAVSHDRWFIERFGGTIWRLEGGMLIRDDVTATASPSP